MEESLITRIAKGDHEAVEALLDRFGSLVWSLARRFSNATEDAEDAAQEIFAEIWAQAHRYDPAIASEATYIAMIARRRLIDRRRKADRRPASAALEESTVVDDKPIDDVVARDDSAQIEAAFKILSRQQQSVIRHSIYDGWTHSEISERMSLPLGTVKSQIRRGLSQLRDHLSDSDSGDGATLGGRP